MAGLFLHKLAFLEDLSLLHAIVDKMPKETLVSALKVQDKNGETPIHIVAYKNNVPATKFLIDLAPAALSIRNKYDNTPLDKAIWKNHALIAAEIIKAAPKLVSSINKSGETPLHDAVISNKLDIILLMKQLAPQHFKEAVQRQGERGVTPAFYAVRRGNLEIMKLILAEDPDAIIKGAQPKDFPYSAIKSLRLKKFLELTKQYVKDPLNKQLHKACVERLSLSHAWHIEGRSTISVEGKKASLFHIDLSGHHAPEWLHKMGKKLDPFAAAYPDLLTKQQLSLMKQLCTLGANPESYSKEEIVHRVDSGLPVLINAGFREHATTVLIWGDRFVICNRGGGMRRAIEIHHFDRRKFNVNILEMIDKVRNSGKEEDYTKLYYKTLPRDLGFNQTQLDMELEKAHALPKQTAGNCTFVSPTTAIYAFLLLGEVCGIETNETLKDPKFDQLKKNYANRVEKAVSNYQIWLADLQLSFLEKAISPKRAGDIAIEPDHKLIVESLRKAHLLPLDTKCQARLENLTVSYTKTRPVKDQGKLKTDLHFWKTLPRRQLL